MMHAARNMVMPTKFYGQRKNSNFSTHEPDHRINSSSSRRKLIKKTNTLKSVVESKQSKKSRENAAGKIQDIDHPDVLES